MGWDSRTLVGARSRTLVGARSRPYTVQVNVVEMCRIRLFFESWGMVS